MTDVKIQNMPTIDVLALDDITPVVDASDTSISKKASEQQRIDLLNTSSALETEAFKDEAVRFPKIQNISSQNILGRLSVGSGAPEELTPADVKTILGLGSAAEEIYQSGNWSPVLEDISSNPYTMFGTIGRFVRIGDSVNIYCSIVATGGGAVSGDLRISGIPFSALVQGSALAVGDVTITGGVGLGQNIVADVEGDFINLHVWDNVLGSDPLTNVEVGTTALMILSGSYFIGS